MLHALAAALVVSAAHAAAVSPETEAAARASHDAPAPRVLEDLVRDMAAGQDASVGASHRDAPEGHDVFILEDTGRRQLGKCSCNEYRNGASPEEPTCGKVESGRTVCMPQHNGRCHGEYVTCQGKKQFDVPTSSPTPYASDEDEDDGEGYVNVNLALSHAGSLSASQLPGDDAFAASLAKLGGMKSGSVHALTSWAAGNGQRSSDATAPSTRVTVHATFTTKGSRRREALEAQLQMTESLIVPGVAGNFEVASLEILDQAVHPLICSPGAESLKADAKALLKQLVALKETELDLVRQAISRGTNPAPSDCDVLRKAAAQLGVDINSR